MKTKLFFIALLAIVLLSAAQCEKEKDLNTLPPETQEGKNTFGCLIDGELYVKGDAPWMHAQISAGYSKSRKSLNVSVYLHPNGYIYMDSFVQNINEQTPIALCYYSPHNGDYTCFCFGGRDIGNITITKLDVENKIISGRFNFDGLCSDIYFNPIGDSTIMITEGRFDIKLKVYD